MSSPALQIFAGPAAHARLAERGLRAEDVGLIPAAAGGPKGLALNGLDRFIFGDWLPQSRQTVHMVGASIGAWRMATAALAHRDVAQAFDAMAEAGRKLNTDSKGASKLFMVPNGVIGADYFSVLLATAGGNWWNSKRV